MAMQEVVTTCLLFLRKNEEDYVSQDEMTRLCKYSDMHQINYSFCHVPFSLQKRMQDMLCRVILKVIHFVITVIGLGIVSILILQVKMFQVLYLVFKLYHSRDNDSTSQLSKDYEEAIDVLYLYCFHQIAVCLVSEVDMNQRFYVVSSLEDYEKLINDIIDNDKPFDDDMGVFYNQVVMAYRFMKSIPGIEDTHIVKFKKQLLHNVDSILVCLCSFCYELEVERKEYEC